ncbi:MAG: uroporphyrinogen-III synthase [Proteobacteria bacterium]|nr:uroporphyrinogen-III synthase [Pseudomonadota bacterium]
MPRILITRAEDDAQYTAQKLQALSYDALIDPILRIYPTEWKEPDWNTVAAIIVTSHNALRGFEEHTVPRDKFFFPVGARTARELRDRGYIHVTGTVEKSDDLSFPIKMQIRPGQGALMHLTSEHAHDAFYAVLEAESYKIDVRHVYHAEESKKLQEATLSALRRGEVKGVLFYSARTATIFQQLIQRHGAAETLRQVHALCLSSSVAGACEKNMWKSVAAAEVPTQDRLMDCLAKTIPSHS